jgi:hypothetical protein
MLFVNTVMLLLVAGIPIAFLLWGLARRAGSEQAQLDVCMVPAGPWRISEPGKLSEEGRKNANLAIPRLDEVLGGRKALLIEPAPGLRLAETYAILAGVNEYEPFPYKEGQRDYRSILLALAENPDMDELDRLAADSIAVLATRTGNIEQLSVILVFDPEAHPNLPKQLVSKVTIKYHRITGEIPRPD